jgi:hypothetical protein
VFKYIAFGLTIESELIFPELFSVEFKKKADIKIKIGPIPQVSSALYTIQQGAVHINNREYHLAIPDVGKYSVSFGEFVLIEPANNCDMKKLRLYCLSNVFAAVLYQRRKIPLHASAIMVKDKLVLMCGLSGSGKSTLLASLISNGYSIFSDDICVPFSDDWNKILMYSSYPMMKFWKETIDQLPFLGEPDVQLRPELNKFGYYFHDRFIQIAVQPELVFFLEKSSQVDKVNIREINGYELFQRLEANAYRGEYLGIVDLRHEHFNLFSSLANQVRGFTVIRPEGEDSVEHITTSVIEKINQYFSLL